MDVTTSRVKVTINGTAAGTEVFEVQIYGELVNTLSGFEQWLIDKGIYPPYVPPYVDPGEIAALLREYALDEDPDVYGDSEPTFTKVTDVFEYSFKQRNDDTNLVYEVQSCADLATDSWTNAGTTGENLGADGWYNNMKHTILPDAPQAYIRLQITSQ